MEDELAKLLIRAGLERGAGIEEIVNEIATMSLPVYFDHEAFRESLLSQIEEQLRREMEERIDRLRLQLSEPQPASVSTSDQIPITSSTIIESVDGDAEARRDEPAESLPSDATMIWIADEQPEKG